jgi:hypothetical protein
MRVVRLQARRRPASHLGLPGVLKLRRSFFSQPSGREEQGVNKLCQRQSRPFVVERPGRLLAVPACTASCPRLIHDGPLCIRWPVAVFSEYGHARLRRLRKALTRCVVSRQPRSAVSCLGQPP